MIRWKTVLLTLLPYLSTAFFVDDSIHHTIEYRLPDDASRSLLKAEDENHVFIRTVDDEEYTCALPDANKQVAEDLSNYQGPTPWELIAPLKDRDICTQKVDPFWSYEICHGKYVKQFHQSKDQKMAFYLGNFHPNYISLSKEKVEKIKVNGEDLPFLPVLYAQGTTCDLTGQPRTTRVLYVCYPTQREVIESITEVSTCNYDVVVLTLLICSHPSFNGSTNALNKIVCTAHNKQSDPTPKAYTPLARAQNQQFHKSFTPTEDRVLKPLSSLKDTTVDLTELYTKMENDREWKKQAEIRFSPSGLDELLSGAACLASGGNEYWKYEYCHLSKITQYHDQTDGSRVQSLIGTFHKERHMQYLSQNPAKRPNRFDGRISQVTHFYSGGSKCGETPELDFHRSAEVRLRCPAKEEKSKDDFYFAVTETSVCHYIISIESTAFCRVIQQADSDGLF